MKVEFFELQTRIMQDIPEASAVTALHVQGDGSILCGLSFCEDLLFKIQSSPKGIDAKPVVLDVGDDALAICGGLRSTTSGDTVFCVLHKGMLPGFLAKLGTGTFNCQSSDRMWNWLFSQDGGIGLFARHSILMLSGGELSIRHHKLPGALIDTALIGDFVFGLNGNSIWREHYLKPEKRETLRSDLSENCSLHRSDDGLFWLHGQNGRLLRMGQMDIKALPTPLKIPASPFAHSCANSIDGWMYGTCADSKVLFRVRRNVESQEEEMQKIAELPQPITAMAAVESEKDPVLVIALRDSSLKMLPLIKPEDPELLPPIPELSDLGKVEGARSLGTLSVSDAKNGVLWAGEGCLGWGERDVSRLPRVLRLKIG